MTLYGIFGNPLGHTLSPAMHEAGFAAIQSSSKYIALELDEKSFLAVMKGLKNSPLSGFNLTVPYKETVIRYLDKLTPEAKNVGAVNTVVKKGKKWIGANTDVYGFKASLENDGKFKAKGKSVLVLGAGGAAKAVVYGLAKSGVKSIVIANRNKARASKLAKLVSASVKRVKVSSMGLRGKAIKEAVLLSDLVINATSLGLKKSDPAVLAVSAIPKKAVKKVLFYDLIYKPEMTPLLKAAVKKGQPTLNGLGMLFYQGVGAFELWTGKKAPQKVMRRELVNALKESGK